MIEVMKKSSITIRVLIAFGVAAAFGAQLKAARAADTSTCYTVGDADARAYCIARARRDPGHCYSVQRSDLRALCLAEVRK